jgi:hypothetical protein
MYHIDHPPLLTLQRLALIRRDMGERGSSSLVIDRDQRRNHLRVSPHIKSAGESVLAPASARPAAQLCGGIGTAEVHNAFRWCR